MLTKLQTIRKNKIEDFENENKNENKMITK